MEQYLDQLAILMDVIIATILSGIIGYEREHLNKPAGLRTNMIIGGASCLIAAITLPLIAEVEVYVDAAEVQTDPIRLLQALVVGISFIGAGTIIKAESDRIHGLTTAATLLYSMSIGICVAIHQYVLAVGVMIIVLIVNFAVRKMEISRKKPQTRNEL